MRGEAEKGEGKFQRGRKPTFNQRVREFTFRGRGNTARAKLLCKDSDKQFEKCSWFLWLEYNVPDDKKKKKKSGRIDLSDVPQAWTWSWGQWVMINGFIPRTDIRRFAFFKGHHSGYCLKKGLSWMLKVRKQDQRPKDWYEKWWDLTKDKVYRMNKKMLRKYDQRDLVMGGRWDRRKSWKFLE